LAGRSEAVRSSLRLEPLRHDKAVTHRVAALSLRMLESSGNAERSCHPSKREN